MGIQVLNDAIEAKRGPGVNPGIFDRWRDFLHDLCVELEGNGTAIEDGDLYLCLFDALASLTEARRGKFVSKVHLTHAMHSMIEARRLFLDAPGSASRLFAEHNV